MCHCNNVYHKHIYLVNIRYTNNCNCNCITVCALVMYGAVLDSEELVSNRLTILTWTDDVKILLKINKH